MLTFLLNDLICELSCQKRTLQFLKNKTLSHRVVLIVLNASFYRDLYTNMLPFLYATETLLQICYRKSLYRVLVVFEHEFCKDREDGGLEELQVRGIFKFCLIWKPMEKSPLCILELDCYIYLISEFCFLCEDGFEGCI